MAPQIVNVPSTTIDLETGDENESKKNTGPDEISAIDDKKDDQIPAYQQDAFGNEEFAEVKYKVLKWWYALRLHQPLDCHRHSDPTWTSQLTCSFCTTGNAGYSWSPKPSP